MRRDIRKKESDHQKTFVCSSKDSNFRISTHAKTLNCLNSLESKTNEERSSAYSHLKQTEGKLRSTYCQPRNQWAAAEIGQQCINTIEISEKMPSKTARVGTFSASKCAPATPLHSIMTNTYTNVKTERQQRKFCDEARQKEGPVRLSLSNFHEKLKSASHSTNKIKKREAEAASTLITTLKLQGKNCRMKKSDNKTPIGMNKQASPNRSKKVIKLAIEQQSNLLQFNRILTKMQMEDSNQSQQIHRLEVKKKTHRSKRAEAQSVSSFHKKSPIKQPFSRQNMKLSIINMTEGKPFQEKARCDEIFMKYFAKSQDFLERAEKEAPLTQSELIRELNDIKRQMALRNSSVQRKQTAQQKVSRYTTSFIEEKLLKRKSLIKSYTFKKGSAELKNEVGPLLEEYFVDGWNIQEADRAEAITS